MPRESTEWRRETGSVGTSATHGKHGRHEKHGRPGRNQVIAIALEATKCIKLQGFGSARARCLRHRSSMHPFERLTAWQKAHEFTLAVLQTIERRTRASQQVLVNQLRRAAISVSANIVEGSGRSTAAQFASFLNIALASAREASYLIRLAADLRVIRTSERAVLEARCDQVCRLIVPLIRHLQQARPRATRRPRASRAPRAARASRPPRASDPSSPPERSPSD